MRGPAWSIRSARLASRLCIGALALAILPTTAAAQSIESFSIAPSHPNTGDRIVLSARLSLPQDCAWTTTVAAGYGTQPEMNGAIGWGIDLTLNPQVGTCAPGTIEIDVAHELGLLPVADAPGVLRLRAGEQVFDTRSFQLAVAPGPAPGFLEPSAHGGLPLFVQAAGMTAIGGGVLAIGDILHREIILFDPVQEVIVASLGSPGNGNIRGLAFDGTHLYASLADTLGPRIYVLDLTGRVLDAFVSPVVAPGSFPLEGLAFKDGILFGTYPSPPYLFAINPATHAKLWQRSLPVRITGIDPAPEGIVGAEPTGLFYLLSASATGSDLLLADAADTGLPGQTQIEGVAYDGQQLYAWDASSATLWSVRTFTLWWATDGTLRAYTPAGGSGLQVIRGHLEAIEQLAGNVDLGPTECLYVDTATGQVDDTGPPPPPGAGYFYMATFTGPGGFEITYGRSSLGFRRIDFQNACP